MMEKNQPVNRMLDFAPFYVMQLLQRAQQLESEGRSVIHMEVGEPDFPTPDPIIKAGQDYLSQGHVKYTPASGLMRLREKIAEYYQATYQVSVPCDRILITPGASGALLLALSVALETGRGLMMADPCYPCNKNFVKFLGAGVQSIPVTEQTRFQLTAELIAQHWQAQTQGVLLASPSNPTGTMVTHTELTAMIKTTERFGGRFFSDEIFHGLVYDMAQTSALQISDQAFVINSFSKYFSMTGWRIGWLIVPEGYQEWADRLAQTLFISTPTHSQYAALAAFKPETRNELEKRRQMFQARRDYLYDSLLNLGFSIPCKPEGAFYIYADCQRLTDNSYQFALDLLEQEGVAVTPGLDFGNNAPNRYIRLAYTSSIDKMNVAIEKLGNFLCKYNK